MTYRNALGWMVLCLLLAAVLRLPGQPEKPPGLHYDEAANVVLVREIAFEGARPVFISSYTGKEVLFFYLAAGVARLIGSSVFALRLTSVFVGLLTIAAAYWLGCELTGKRRVALIAAALLAVSFWHVLFSHYGFRANSQPLLQALTAAALFRGLRLSKWSWLAAAGALLGLTAYTYLASRLFPLLLLLALWPLLLPAATRRRHFLHLAGVTVLALIVLLPLLRYFQLHPDAFWVRIGQVAPGQGEASLTLWQSYIKSLGMLFYSGDPYARFNLPGRPIFPWFWGIPLVIGWLVALVCTWRSSSGRQRAAYLLLILAPLIMILPTALAVNEIVPSNIRAVGLNPFIFYLPALGMDTILRIPYSVLKKFSSIRNTQYAIRFFYPFTLLAILLLGSSFTYRLYFQQWATRSDVFYESDSDLVAAAGYLDQLDTNNHTLYVAALHYRHPTIAALSQKYDLLKWLPGSNALVIPAAGPSLYLYPHSSPAPDWLAAHLSGAIRRPGPNGPDGRPLYTTYELNTPPALALPNPANANFENVATLLGYEFGPVAAGQTLSVTLLWRIDRTPPTSLMPFVHLEDEWGYRWGQTEATGYPSEQWQPGELFIEQVMVPVRPGAPPGRYHLRAGLFDPSTGRQLAHLDNFGRYAGSALTIDNVTITAGLPPDPLPSPPIAIGQTATPSLQLLGYERAGNEVAQGDTLWLALWWQATAPLPAMTSRLELIRPDNTGLILTDSQPVHGRYPFHTWQTPQFVIDHLSTQVVESVAPGDYRLQLRLLDSADETLLTAELGPLKVTKMERLYTPPQLTFPLDATFGDEIRLLSYDLVPMEAGNYLLSLAWQATAQPQADYTVFVHLLGLDGVCCVWQQDVMPGQGGYPTGRWLPGEVVVDDYIIIPPDGSPAGLYPLEIGLYRAENGQRLVIRVPGTADSDSLYLRPIVVE